MGLPLCPISCDCILFRRASSAAHAGQGYVHRLGSESWNHSGSCVGPDRISVLDYYRVHEAFHGQKDEYFQHRYLLHQFH